MPMRFWLFVFAFSLLHARQPTDLPGRRGFEENLGQTRSTVDFLTRVENRWVFLEGGDLAARLGHDGRGIKMRIGFLAAGETAAGLRPLPIVSNYYSGKDQKKWRPGIRHFQEVAFGTGRRIRYYFNGDGKLEFDLELPPGTDPAGIALRFDNSEAASIESSGRLRVERLGEAIILGAPRAIQNGRLVRCSYSMDGDAVRFKLGEYDPSQPLVIDPEIEFATYLGGNAADVAQDIDIDASGSPYITGYLESPQYPVLDPFMQVSGSAYDVFVAKFSPQGNRVAYYTYLGGSFIDAGTSIRVDPAGNAYVGGFTASPDFSTLRPAQPAFGGGFENAFIAKLNPQGRLIYATYLGGNNQERVHGLAVDAAGQVYLSGFTWSKNFPVVNAVQPRMSGQPDAFVAKLSAQGDRFLFATYLGGSAADYGQGLALDRSGNILVVGSTESPDFPVRSALQSRLMGNGGFPNNGFLVRLRNDGGEMMSSTYLLGRANGGMRHVATDSTGSVIAQGSVRDPDAPVINALQSTFGGGLGDIYIVKLDPDASSIQFATYFGGSDIDFGSLAIDAQDHILVAGATYSRDFPLKNSLMPFVGAPVRGFKCDAFLFKLSPSGNLVYSTLFGGTGGDFASSIVSDPHGAIYIGGNTSSEDYPVKSAVQAVYGGGATDLTILKFKPELAIAPPALSALPASLPFTWTEGQAVPVPQTVSLTGTAGAAYTVARDVEWLAVAPASSQLPSSLRASVNVAGLSPGIHHGEIRIVSGGVTERVAVSLRIYAKAPQLSELNPDALPLGSEDVTIAVRGSGFVRESEALIGTSALVTAFVDSSTLRVVLPKTIFIAEVTIPISVRNPESQPSNALPLAVGPIRPRLAPGGIVNAASYRGGFVSAGEIVTIFGSGFGDTARSRVYMDGIPVMPLYALTSQIGVVVPSELVSKRTVLVTVDVEGRSSDPATVVLVPASPGIFTANSSGKGYAAALNQDGSVNAPANPAARGSVIVLYATGGGPLNADGRFALPVKVFMDGIECQVLYAGQAPGLVPGALQINAVIPEHAVHGEVVLQVDGVDSQSEVRIALQ